MILRRRTTVSNTERQRRFRERNPGYYQRLHAKRRAEMNAMLEAKLAAMAEVTVAKREPLMLPAPVEVIEIPGMNTIEAIRVAENDRLTR